MTDNETAEPGVARGGRAALVVLLLASNSA